jgi:hypothetical protein
LLLLTLPLKLAWHTAADPIRENEVAQAQRLHRWLDAIGMPIERDVQPKPRLWEGWQVRLPGCSVVLLPRPDFDGTELLGRLIEGHELRYVYEGRISDQPPFIATMFAKARSVVAPFLARPSDGLVVMVAAPKGCRDYETLDWTRLWWPHVPGI